MCSVTLPADSSCIASHLFIPTSRAARLLAANSGWYTVPAFDDVFPDGGWPTAFRHQSRSKWHSAPTS